MPHSIPVNFNLVRTYFCETGDVVINLSLVKTIKVVDTKVYFNGLKDVVGVVDFYVRELALEEFRDIVSSLNDCAEWRKKND